MTGPWLLLVVAVLCTGAFVVFMRPRTDMSLGSHTDKVLRGESRIHVHTTPRAVYSNSKTDRQKRRLSSLWVIRESSDRRRLEVLAKTENLPHLESMLRLPSSLSKHMEIPRVAALRALEACCGLSELQVETFKQVRHGPFELPSEEFESSSGEILAKTVIFRDMTSYVAVVVGKNAKIATEHADDIYSGNVAWIPLNRISESLQLRGTSPDKNLDLSRVMRDDFGSVQQFLTPFAQTVGMNPIQCLGRPPPGWKPTAVVDFPTLRSSNH